MGTVKSAGVSIDHECGLLHISAEIPGNSHYSVLNFVKYENKNRSGRDRESRTPHGTFEPLHEPSIFCLSPKSIIINIVKVLIAGREWFNNNLCHQKDSLGEPSNGIPSPCLQLSGGIWMKKISSFESHEKITSYELDKTEFLKLLNIDAHQILNMVVEMDVVHIQVRETLGCK